MGRVVVVGGGILGTMHAVLARRRGWHVCHLERDLEPRGATVRNFGLIWVSGRAPGAEVDTAQRARALWQELAAEAPDVGFRPDGSLTLVTTDAERQVLVEVCERPDAAARGFELLEWAELRSRHAMLGGRHLAALWCRADAVVEPGRALPALRARLAAGDGYEWHGGTTVAAIEPGRVVDQRGTVHGGDLVIVCPGAVGDGPIGELLEGAPLRRVQLQMMQTAPWTGRLPASLADADSLRYYPAFDVPARKSLPPQNELARDFALQLLVSQRASGALTVGDTHRSAEPFDFALDERPFDELERRLRAAVDAPLPPIVRRWSGVYSQLTGAGLCHRAEPRPGVWVVTGAGGRGMTLAPALAETTWEMVG